MIMGTLIFILLFGLVASTNLPDSCYDRMNIILPKVVVPGQSTTALVHFHEKREQHNVTLRLIRPENEFHTDVLAQNTIVIKGNGIVWLTVPSQENGIYEMQVLLDCTPTDENCTLQTSSKVKLSGSIRDVIIRPSSNYYRPGETIVFWILAIDQNLHAPFSTLVKLYVKDPNGISQAVWEDIPLFEGTKEFRVPISERASLGKWTIDVQTEGNTYSSELNVSLARGSNQLPNREQVVTEKHFVELHFSDKMRRKYKPGLPLMGKVEAVSSEEEVRIRVKVIDDQLTILYSQDIDMSGREGTFYVPAVITNTEEITVQAELISLGGKDVDSQYVLARETLHKWKSESNCYLLIKDLHVDLKPDTDAEMTVLTSCSCSGDVHYIISTEGKMVSWGELTLTNETNVPVALDSIMQGVNIYEFNISFSIEAEMAPTSHLLVYYTSESGEIIGDSIHFHVNLRHERVSLILNENNVWYMGEEIKVGILAFPKTHICLVGGRSEDIHFWNRLPQQLNQQVLEDDLSFLTSCRRREETFRIPKHESYFPNTLINQAWLWKCFNYTEEIETKGITLPATSGAGKWKLWAFSLSDTVELRISDPVTINVFSPVNIEFELPATVKVMEIVQVEITISSNINACIDIHALIALSEGVVYPGIDMSIVSEKLRLGGHGATSIVVRIQPVTPGLKTMTANVSCLVRESCEETAMSSEDSTSQIPIKSVITHSKQVEAVPEGIQKIHSESAYFCANEMILTLESRSIRYTFIPAPRKKYYIIFDAQAAGNFHVAIAEQENSTKNIYQIYLGDFDNTISWIGRGKHNYEVHLSSARTPDILSDMKYRTFWLSWENAVINIGKGSIVGKDPFLTHIMDKKMRVNFLGFSTSFGVEGRVRISEHNDDSGYSQVLRLDIPHHILPGSEKGYLYVTAGLTLPIVIQNLGSNLHLHPFSSLAAVLSSLTTVLLLNDYAGNSEWLHSKYNISYMHDITQTNIQTLLTYKNKDCSFSDHPNISDYSNTVKAFDILSRAQYFWNIDSELIAGIKLWIKRNQKDDGHFENNSSSTLEEKLVITAETLATFLEIGYDETDECMFQRGQKFLEDNIQLINDTYILSVACYTFTLLQHNIIDNLLGRMHIPMRTDEKESDWQNSQSSSVPSPFDWLYDREKRISDDEKRDLISSFVADFKASAYAVLIHTLRKDLQRAEPIVKYIYYRSNILDNHPELSYLVAKSLNAFTIVLKDSHPSLTISLATSGMELTDTLELKSDYKPHELDLPSLPTKVFIYATGAGCSTVQSRVAYLTYDTETAYSFDFSSYIEDEIPAHYNVVGDPEGLYPQLIMKSCLRSKHHSQGFRIEAFLFSGYKLDSILSLSPSTADFSYGSTGDKVWFVFANVSANCGICVRYLIQSSFIISSLRPIFFRMYEIETPQIMHELFVHSTNKESLLRTDITDAHFVTWFGSITERSEQLDDDSHFYQCESLHHTISLISPPSNEIRQFENNNKIMVVDVDNFQDEQNITSSTLFTTIQTTANDLFTREPVSEHTSTYEMQFEAETKSHQTPISMNSAVSHKTENTHPYFSNTMKTTSKSAVHVTESIIRNENRSYVTHTSKLAFPITNQQPYDENLNFPLKSTSYYIQTETTLSTEIPLQTTQLHRDISSVGAKHKWKKVKDEIKYKMKPKFNIHLINESAETSKPETLTTIKPTMPIYNKNVKKVVVGQNELCISSNSVLTAGESLISEKQSSDEKPSTVSSFWGLLKEVAYDTRRKQTLS